MTLAISQADIIYFIVTDRFHDGDPDNNFRVDKTDPRRYHGGDFPGIRQKIPYLKHLGITALWITPVYLGIGPFTRSGITTDGYHGYWPMDFERVNPHLAPSESNGRLELRNLAEELHANGIKLILDIVVNHTGYHTPEYKNYPHKKIRPEWFNPAIPGPGLTEEEKKYKEPLYGLPSLNHDLADVRDYFVNNIADWIEDTGIDGLRMDAVPHIEKDFWYYFKSYIRGKYRHIFFLGEDLEYDEESVARYQREHDFDSLFDFPLQRNIIEVLIMDESHKPPAYRAGMTAIAGPRYGERSGPGGVLDADRKYSNPNRLVTLLDNHDLEKRVMSWAMLKTGGNRRKAAELVKYALTFQFTTRGIPQIYYGTEVCMEGDRNDGGDFMVRADMPWHKIDPLSHEPYPEYREELGVYRHLRRLIQIRKENEAIPFGYLFTLYSDFFIYVYMREFRGNTVIVAMNNGTAAMRHPLRVNISANRNIPSRIKENLAARKKLVNLFEEGDIIEYRHGSVSVLLGAKEARVYRLEE
ncbi:MAG: hypothetical protein K6T66_08285 [Peptococcaceae bacterium]|nr:hypothetical protein [Peptococcaceae bacterium]